MKVENYLVKISISIKDFFTLSVFYENNYICGRKVCRSMADHLNLHPGIYSVKKAKPGSFGSFKLSPFFSHSGQIASIRATFYLNNVSDRNYYLNKWLITTDLIQARIFFELLEQQGVKFPIYLKLVPIKEK